VNVWLTIIAAGILTYLTRLSFIFLLGRTTMPRWFMRGLRFVPVAVLSAIIVPETVTWHGQSSLSWHNPQIWAALVAVLVGLRVKNVLVIIAAGMVAFLVFQWALGQV
jgi:branched-subunit amino acid transport protein